MKVVNTIVFALMLALTACASDTTTRVGTAATTPLSDLNIVKAKIPQVLKDSEKHPYLLPTDQSCAAIVLEIHNLDEVLGADLDMPSTDKNPSLIERGASAAKDSAIRSLQHSAEGIVPYRGWIRKLSGAERYSKHVAAAITAGSIRRAFLKGIAASHDCTWNDSSDVASLKPEAK
jgi:hypothetical protein